MHSIDKRHFDERYEDGLETRRQVIGQAATDQRMASVNSFNRPLHELLNTYCFNDVWNRPGINHRTRSMLNIGMLCALNRPHELQAHLNAAINNGVTPSEIQEVLLQVAVYCGVPAAVEGFRIAQVVLDEREINVT